MRDLIVVGFQGTHRAAEVLNQVLDLNADWAVDLRPGDVITRVNGHTIEHPEDADAAMRSLEKAPSLKVDYERDGKLRTLEIPIVD